MNKKEKHKSNIYRQDTFEVGDEKTVINYYKNGKIEQKHFRRVRKCMKKN